MGALLREHLLLGGSVNASHTAGGFCYTVTGGDTHLNVVQHFNNEVKSHSKSRTNKTKEYQIYSVKKKIMLVTRNRSYKDSRGCAYGTN